jgi:hypothetical protein
MKIEIKSIKTYDILSIVTFLSIINNITTPKLLKKSGLAMSILKYYEYICLFVDNKLCGI